MPRSSPLKFGSARLERSAAYSKTSPPFWSLSFIKTRFFWKLYLTYTLVFICIILMVGLLAFTKLKSTLWQEFQTKLEEKIALLNPYARASLSGKHQGQDIQQLAVQLGQESNTRISLILPSGRVLADSAESPQSLKDNHWQRPEVEAARRVKYGRSVRHSSSLAVAMLYVAQIIETDEQVLGALRVALPIAEIDSQLDDLRLMMVGVALLGVFLTLLAGLLLARRVTEPLSHMMECCNAISAGDYSYQVPTLPRDEIGLLGQTINRLGKEISAKIATISLERAQLKSMLAAMIEGIISVDSNNRVLFCNQAAYQLLDCPLKDCRKMKLGEIPGFSLLTNHVKQARESGHLAEGELTSKHESKEKILECHALPFAGSDASGVMVVVHDVTRIRQLEHMRRDFVANVSHEIKTPLTSIKGYVETLLGGALYDQSINTRFLTKVHNNTNRLITLVHDILSLAKIESHNTDFHWERVSWPTVIELVLAQYEDHLRAKQLVVEKSYFQPVYIQGDKEAMTQILDNLITNAIRYSQPKGTIRITLSQRDDYGLLQIQDTGIGIPRQDQQRIFQRFYRVDKDRSRELGGTGLGLSIVKHLVSSLQGSIDVVSEVGVGSVFIVSLPLA